MKIRIDRPLRFWVDVAYENIASDHPKLTKRQLIAQILHQYQERGNAMRYLDASGKIAWKASPRCWPTANAMLRMTWTMILVTQTTSLKFAPISRA